MSHVALNKYSIHHLNQKLLSITEAKKGATGRAKPLPSSRNRPRVDPGIPWQEPFWFFEVQHKYRSSISDTAPICWPSSSQSASRKVFSWHRNAMTSVRIVLLPAVVTLLAHAGHPSPGPRCGVPTQLFGRCLSQLSSLTNQDVSFC